MDFIIVMRPKSNSVTRSNASANTMFRWFHALMYSYVIDKHSLREDRSYSWAPGPISTDGEVEENEKRLIEDPRFSRRKIGRSSSLIKNPIAVKAYDVRLPLDREGMKRIGESLVVRQ
jgi:hypothetical protein